MSIDTESVFLSFRFYNTIVCLCRLLAVSSGWAVSSRLGSEASQKYNHDFTELSSISYDKFALHIHYKTRQAKIRQIDAHAAGVATKSKIRQGEEFERIVKKKYSHGVAAKKEAYKDSLPFQTSSIVTNGQLREYEEKNGTPLEFHSPSMLKCIALDLGVRNLCGYAIEYIHGNVPVVQLEPYDYTIPGGRFPPVKCNEEYLAQETGVISTKSVYQETGVSSRNYTLQKRVQTLRLYNEEFVDEEEELQKNSMKSVNYDKLVLNARTMEKCLYNQHGRCYNTPERSKTKFMNRIRMKQYFKKLFQFFISRHDMYHENAYPQDNSNFAFIGGKDTFGKGLSKKLMTAIAMENKSNAVANQMTIEDSKKRLQINNENEFRTSKICP